MSVISFVIFLKLEVRGHLVLAHFDSGCGAKLVSVARQVFNSIKGRGQPTSVIQPVDARLRPSTHDQSPIDVQRLAGHKA